ncbi:hypothetical protein M9H77_08810 [Catharanthus roseus]|uniref:Uncharacterized protein n=1 Tax=Catharanthus roseus TaxID=4058 RepID=A0ACC0BYX8_CATRO|nr:hypothetical protein M9H77_08810 [Catharanthus roseus]
MSKIYESRYKRSDNTCDIPTPTQRKKVKSSDWEQTGQAEGGPVDPELYDGHDRDLLKRRSRYMALELFDVATDPQSRLSSSGRAACYIQHLLGSSLFTDKSGNIVPSKLWPLAWIYMYFPMFAPSVRPGTQSCKPYIQQFFMLGHKTEHKLLDIRLRLDMMSADEVRFRQCIPAHPVRPMEACRPANNRMYVVRKSFVEALWLEAPSHLLIETWTSVSTIPPSSPQDIESHERFRRFHVPVDPPMPVSALMDMIAREMHRNDTRKEEKYDKITDLVKRHYHST